MAQCSDVLIPIFAASLGLPSVVCGSPVCYSSCGATEFQRETFSHPCKPDWFIALALQLNRLIAKIGRTGPKTESQCFHGVTIWLGMSTAFENKFGIGKESF
ncbi:MAG: hypothetical protein DKT66_15740 [Candidatus Melainabacteria bacterium]|nr:MAG: hypothetical protein DKT66_15740 [Candidatus Melainabacteria bacterium]